MTIISDYVAFKMRERLLLTQVFYEVKGFPEIPLSFTDCRFLYKHKFGTGLLNFKDLLKKWVYEKSGGVSDGSGKTSSSRGDVSSQSMSAGGKSDGSGKTSSSRGDVSSQSMSAGDAGSKQGSRAKQQSSNDDQVHTNSDDFCRALANLNQTLSEENLDALQKIQKQGDLTEDQILVGVGVHLIKQLTGRALTNRKKSETKCPCGCEEKLEFSRKMYIGSEETLHGELDLLSESGVGVIAKVNVEVEEAAKMDKEGESEAAEKDVSACQQQVIAQAITFGWTEFNKLSHLSPFIPSLYLDKKQLGVLVYNPQDDSLMISEKSVLFINENMENEDKYAGIFLLWIILHHRLFFRKNIDFNYDDVACGFIKQVDVDAYKRLNTYSERILHTIPGFKWKPTGLIFEPYKGVRKRKRSESDQGHY